MSTNYSSDEIFISTLNLLSSQLNRYLSIFILLFGTVGNLLNCLALSQRDLRSNPCASLFLASSIASLTTLIAGLSIHIVSGWGADLTGTVGWVCKLRIFMIYVSRTIASWLITMATIDRWLSSSLNVHLRRISSLRNAQRAMIIVTITSILAYSQVFYCYEANMINSPVKCSGKTPLCRLVFDIEMAFVSVIIPSLLMLTFGLLTIFNIRQSHMRRIQPATQSTINSNNQNNSQLSKKTDRSLLMMLSIQVVLLTLFSLPQVLHTLYTNIIRGQVRSPLQNTISSVVLNVFFLFSYMTNGMPFYIYTLSGGTVFRRALSNAMRELLRKLLCQRE